MREHPDKLIGKKYSKLKVLSYSKINNKIYLKCKCDCGNVKDILRTTVTRKKQRIRSCGCLAGHLKQGEAAFNRLYYNYIQNCKKRNKKFNLTKEQFKKLTKQDCYYCGLPPSTENKFNDLNGSYFYNGIDRVNNSKNYTQKNCVSCCKTCNYAKHKLVYKEFLQFIKRAHKHLRRTKRI